MKIVRMHKARGAPPKEMEKNVPSMSLFFSLLFIYISGGHKFPILQN